MHARKIVVIGAGVIGVTTAHVLRAEGHDVTLLEASPAAASGTSLANGGYLSAAFCAPWAMPGLPMQAWTALFNRQAPFRWRPDGSLSQLRWLRDLWAHCNAADFSTHRQRMVRLALLSRVCLQDVVAQTGVSFDFQSSGVLQIFRQAPPSQIVEKRLQELQAFGCDAHWYEPHLVRAMEPGLSHSVRIAGGLHVRDDASGDCERFVQGLLAWNQARGLLFESNVRVDSLELDARGERLCAVRSRSQRWQADAFVFATGVDTARLLRPYMRVPIVPVKGYSVTVSLAHRDGTQGAVIDDTSKLAIARLGQRVRLTGMAEVVGHDRYINNARCQQLVHHYASLYGPLPEEGRQLWAGLRPMTPDGTPIIGATPVQGLYLNAGHGTYGWTLACGSAQLLADVIAQRPCAVSPDAYALDPALRALA
jgi:D-amino-acid dehydrogenase